MTPKIIARVDSWLFSRRAWLLSTEYRDWLHHEWRLAVDRFNSNERAGAREAVAACLAGCLLSLVMEAWGAEAWFQPSPSRNAKIEGWMVVVFGRGIVGRGATLAEAIVAALEAAS
ncbi:MAG: hypothetical protein M0R28_17890 [Pigmentiphaga sp.]|nr:hypothetical protein [Pigmentiphaga sp.]